MIEYEWSIQEQEVYVDDDGVECFEINNHDFADRLEQYGPIQWGELDGRNYQLVLIRRDWAPDFMNQEMEYAEAIRDDEGRWVLPVNFANVNGNETRNVPKRFHAELAKRQAAKD